MKRLLAGFLGLATAISSLQLPALAENPPDQDGPKGTITAMIKFDYPEDIERIGNKNLQVSLKEKASGSLSVTLDGNATNEERIKTTPLNEMREPVTGQQDIYYYQIEYSGVQSQKEATISLSGKGYTPHTRKISLDQYSKGFIVGTSGSLFTMGDADLNNKVEKADLQLVADKLGGTSDKMADLNGDGIIDIADIALVNHNLHPAGEEITEFETTLIPAAAGVKVDVPENVVVEGTAESILTGDAPVTFSPADPSQKELSIPIEFGKNGSEMNSVSIATPVGDGQMQGGTLEVEYINGEKEQLPFGREALPTDVHELSRQEGSNTIVIPLGKRVAVKKITIKVNLVEDQIVVVEEVKFLKDIIPENPSTDTIPQNVTAEPGDGKVSLSWKPVHNVTGYQVEYGTVSGTYTKMVETETASATVQGLDNLTAYYFAVTAINGDWKGGRSVEISAVPQPSSAPLAPGSPRLNPIDSGLEVSWGKTKNALAYHVYCKKTEDGDKAFQKVGEGIKELSFTIPELENGAEYSVYLTASNDKGESKPSLTATAIPNKPVIEIPKLPTYNRIPNSEIEKITMHNPNNTAVTPFDPNVVIDEDFNTAWTASAYWESKKFYFEFKEEHTMDYVVYVPRLDGDGKFKKALYRYTISVWDEQGNQTDLTPMNFADAPGVTNNPGTTGFAILPFPKTEHIKKIAVEVNQWDGAASISLAEIAFYEYSDLAEQVRALFTDDSCTSLVSGVTDDRLDTLETMITDTEGYYVDQECLLDELKVARGLLAGDESVLGKVLDGIDSRDTKGNVKPINTFQPLGVVAKAKSKVVIYADMPEGETVRLVPTQYFAEASSWAGSAIELKKGRNIITIPQLTSVLGEKGGALYIQYAGESPEKIKLHVRGAAVPIPVLELAHWDDMTENQRKDTIGAYVDELNEYTAGLGTNNLKTMVRNSTEISLPNVLLSLPASQVRSGLKNGSREEQIQGLYHNAQAWEDLISVLYTTHGIDDPAAERSRHNIRYARMNGGAFMYASGAHIGIGYDSASGMVNGRPVSVTGEGNPNGMFGWGIAHEIGHVMDTIGKAEISNNIYSLFGQTYDGGSNAIRSRLEGGIYDKIFEKTAMGSKGQANNVFVSLGMYWQLHLAYDGESDNFFGQLNQYAREKNISLRNDEQFAIAASAVAGADLTEFFTRWGMELSDSAKSQMTGSEESRKIYYLDDDSRRARLEGKTPADCGDMSVSVKADQDNIQLSIQIDNPEDIQGYEISRDDGRTVKTIAFSRDTDFTEKIGSLNNRMITYSVKAIDILGNVAAEAEAEPMKFGHDNLIGRGAWTSEKQEDGSILVTFQSPQEVAGFRVKAKTDIPETTDTEETTTGDETSSTDEADSDRPEEESSSEPEAESSEPPESLPDDTEESTEGPETSEEPESSETEQTELITEALRSIGLPARVMNALFASSLEESRPDPEENESSSPADETEESTEETSQETTDGPAPEESTTGETSDTAPDDETTTGEEESSSPDTSEDPGTESAPESETEESTETTDTTDTSVSDDNADSKRPEELPKTSGTMTVEVSEDGESYATVKTIDLSQDPVYGTSDRLHYFTKGGAEDGGIGIFTAKTIRITGLPKELSMEDLDFFAYPGDDIEFYSTAVGRMKSDYRYGEDSGDVIRKDTLVIIGTYRGDPVYNTIEVKGRFLDGTAGSGEESIVERAVNGEAILFAQIPEEGEMSEISDGLWIFVLDEQEERELQTESGCYNSILPTEVMAVLYRTDTPDGSSGRRVVSETRWISAPTDESMPQIEIGGTEQ